MTDKKYNKGKTKISAGWYCRWPKETMVGKLCKHETKFRGVGIPDIREKLKEWYENESVEN